VHLHQSLLSCPRTRRCLSRSNFPMTPDHSRPPWFRLDRANDAKRLVSRPKCRRPGNRERSNHRQFPPHRATFQAVKNRLAGPQESTPIDAFCGSFQWHACMKCPMKNPSNEASRTTFLRPWRSQKTAKTRYNFLKIKPPSAPIQPHSSRAADSQGRLLQSRRGSDFTLDDHQPASTLTRKRQW